VSIVDEVLAQAASRILFLPHALHRMQSANPMITEAEVSLVVSACDVIEDYPTDVRGHSCLLLGRGEMGRALHVLCSPKMGYLTIITAYLPDPGRWSDDFRRRR
jgi:hypothetical protein